MGTSNPPDPTEGQGRKKMDGWILCCLGKALLCFLWLFLRGVSVWTDPKSFRGKQSGGRSLSAAAPSQERYNTEKRQIHSCRCPFVSSGNAAITLLQRRPSETCRPSFAANQDTQTISMRKAVIITVKHSEQQ
uniref:Uncharacterized protein n=1 Tax=Poecilia reticulata TaxID=8081 RepID=A0A3P9NXL1_POERE